MKKIFLSLILVANLFAQANWNNPTNTSTYSDVLTQLKARDLSCLKQDPTSDSNTPDGAIRQRISFCNGAVSCHPVSEIQPFEYKHSSGWLPVVANEFWKDSITVGGTANAITITTSPAVTVGGPLDIIFKASSTNTGATTLALNGIRISATDIRVNKNGSSASSLTGGEIRTGNYYHVKYDSANSIWILSNPSPTISWLTWTVSGTSVTGGGTWTSLANTNSYREEPDGTVKMKLKILGTITGAVNRFEVPLPVNTSYSVEQTSGIYCYQNGALVGCYVNIEPSTDKMYVSKYDNSNFTAGANGGFVIDASYRKN